MSKKPETNLKENILPILRQLPNAWVCKIQQVAKRGTPDILMCLSGFFIAIELKSEDGEVDPLQTYNLDKIAKCGGLAMVISPKNYKESVEFLAKISADMAENVVTNMVMN